MNIREGGGVFITGIFIVIKLSAYYLPLRDHLLNTTVFIRKLTKHLMLHYLGEGEHTTVIIGLVSLKYNMKKFCFVCSLAD